MNARIYSWEKYIVHGLGWLVSSCQGQDRGYRRGFAASSHSLRVCLPLPLMESEIPERQNAFCGCELETLIYFLTKENCYSQSRC